MSSAFSILLNKKAAPQSFSFVLLLSSSYLNDIASRLGKLPPTNEIALDRCVFHPQQPRAISLCFSYQASWLPPISEYSPPGFFSDTLPFHIKIDSRYSHKRDEQYAGKFQNDAGPLPVPEGGTSYIYVNLLRILSGIILAFCRPVFNRHSIRSWQLIFMRNVEFIPLNQNLLTVGLQNNRIALLGL